MAGPSEAPDTSMWGHSGLGDRAGSSSGLVSPICSELPPRGRWRLWLRQGGTAESSPTQVTLSRPQDDITATLRGSLSPPRGNARLCVARCGLSGWAPLLTSQWWPGPLAPGNFSGQWKSSAQAAASASAPSFCPPPLGAFPGLTHGQEAMAENSHWGHRPRGRGSDGSTCLECGGSWCPSPLLDSWGRGLRQVLINAGACGTCHSLPGCPGEDRPSLGSGPAAGWTDLEGHKGLPP